MKYSLSLITLLSLNACREGRMIVDAFRTDAPPSSERRVMRERADSMFEHLSDRRVLVLPVAVIGRQVTIDSSAADELSQRLRADSLALTTVAARMPELAFEPSSNESRIFWSRFRALAAEVKRSPQPVSDYVLLVDVFGGPDDGRLGAVHAMVVTSSGDMVYGAAWNASHKLFKQMQPRSASDAVRMVAVDLAQRR